MAKRRVEIGLTGEGTRQRIQKARKQLGLTLGEVAARLAGTERALSVNTISEIENGARRVDVDDLVALAYVLEVTPDWLLFDARPDRAAGGSTEVSGTVVGSRPATHVWEWLDGARPLFKPDEDPRTFTGRVRPTWRRTVDYDAATVDGLRRDFAHLVLDYETVKLDLEEAQAELAKKGADDDGNG